MTTIDTSLVEVSAPSNGPAHGNGTFGALGLLVRRRLWRDRFLVLGSALIVALATLLALSGPALVSRTIDDGAADAVTAAGPNGDIVITVPIGNPNGDNVSSIRGIPVQDFAALATDLADSLPA